MKPLLPLAAIAATVFLGAAVAAPSASAQAQSTSDAFWARAQWDDDDDDGRRAGPIPRPDAAALRAAGIVSVREVERDDGRLEIEGRDARGREIDVLMDAKGRKVLTSRVDRDDDRWDDDDDD